MAKKNFLVIKKIEQYKFFETMMKIHSYLTKYSETSLIRTICVTEKTLSY